MTAADIVLERLMSEKLYHCQDCNHEWYYPHPNGCYCADCGSENIYRYPELKYKPQQGVRCKLLGALYRAKTTQIAEVRSDEQGGWVYLLPKDLYPLDGCMFAEFSEDALEPREYERKLNNSA